MINIGALINTFVEENGQRRIFNEQRAVALWKEINGPFIAKETRSVSIRNGVLQVRVQNAALRFELLGQKQNIINKINATLGAPVVKDIILQ